MSNRTITRLRSPAGQAAFALVFVLLPCACASSAPSSGSASPATPAAATCQHVGAVLSDGPDPGADPVGYAEAQIRPLRQLNVPNPALRAAVRRLADAYQSYFASNGTSSTAREAVAVASRKVNALCPGAAS
jgi:hypothetical protein